MRRYSHRGFSLIEAAIVLGIVGLVIGGIWVAASAVQTQIRLARMQEFVINVHSKLNSFSKTMSANFGAQLGITSLVRDVLPPGYTVADTSTICAPEVRIKLLDAANSANTSYPTVAWQVYERVLDMKFEFKSRCTSAASALAPNYKLCRALSLVLMNQVIKNQGVIIWDSRWGGVLRIWTPRWTGIATGGWNPAKPDFDELDVLCGNTILDATDTIYVQYPFSGS